MVIEGKFQLIETAAERVAERLIADYGLDWVRVEVVKPIPSEGYTAAITIERGPVPQGEAGLVGTRAQILIAVQRTAAGEQLGLQKIECR